MRPPLPESDIAREEKALDAAIAQIEGSHTGRKTPLRLPLRRPGRRRRRARRQPQSRAPRPFPRRRPARSGARAPAPPNAACGARAIGLRAAIAFRGARVKPVRARSERGRSARRRAATFAAGSGAQPAGRNPATSASRASKAGRSRAGGRGFPFFNSVPARCGDGRLGFRPRRPFSRAEGRQDEGLPGVSALDPARAVRPSRADDGRVSDAPPVMVGPRDEPVQVADAPEVAAEMDRLSFGARPDLEIQRPVAPGADVAKPQRWLWIGAAVLLGVVLAVAGAAILMRQKPQDLAIKPAVEAQKLAPPKSSAKIAERVEPAAPPPSAPPAARGQPASGPAERSRRGGPGGAGDPGAERRTRPRRRPRRRRPAERRCWSPRPTIRRSRW